MNRGTAYSIIALFCTALSAGTANAADPTNLLKASRKEPAMLTADQVGYDTQTSIATAIGHVEIVQGETVLLADRVAYSQKTDVVEAYGHVSILQPTGDVFFSDHVILRDKMEKGVVQQLRARLADNSLFAAREGRKKSKNVTVLSNAVYSPCKVCQPKPGEMPSAPLWQVKAGKATLDEDAKRIYYQNAFFDIYGVPVLYTPYFSHPSPDAPNQSGLLMPQYFHATDLGTVIKEPLYITLAPNMDMTLTPWYLSQEKPLLEGEFRYLGKDSAFEARGAITNTYNRDDGGNIIDGTETRGYIDAHGKIKLSEYWNAGLDAERTTDKTFLQLYRFGWQEMLTSRLYAERIQDRNYAVVETLAFQGLQPQDVRSVSPYVLPQGTLHYETEPGFAHSRFTVDGNALVLERSEGDSDQRLSTSVSWKLPYVTHNGQIYEFSAMLRGDAYHVEDLVTDPTTNASFNGDTGRVIPQVEFDWRYPFVNRFGEGKSLMLSPIIQVMASPNMHMTSNIPNEDSQLAELSDINLFSADRFPGLDEVESGLRGTYGLRGELQFADDAYVQWLFGEAYQQNANSPFPITDTQTPAHFSDYIGRVAMKYKWIDVIYSLRADRDTLEPTSNTIDAIVMWEPFSLDASYVSLRNDPLFGNRQEVFGSVGYDVTKNWKLSFNGRRDLGSDNTQEPVNPALPVVVNPFDVSAGTVGVSGSLIYHNECLMVATTLGRNYINEGDLKPSTTFSVTVTLKNFGNPSSPGTHATNPSGAGNISAVSSRVNAPVAPAGDPGNTTASTTTTSP